MIKNLELVIFNEYLLSRNKEIRNSLEIITLKITYNLLLKQNNMFLRLEKEMYEEWKRQKFI